MHWVFLHSYSLKVFKTLQSPLTKHCILYYITEMIFFKEVYNWTLCCCATKASIIHIDDKKEKSDKRESSSPTEGSVEKFSAGLEVSFWN